jgi:hypothetical protein
MSYSILILSLKDLVVKLEAVTISPLGDHPSFHPIVSEPCSYYWHRYTSIQYILCLCYGSVE